MASPLYVPGPFAMIRMGGMMVAGALALGGIVGSFLNVCASRLPKGRSLWMPGSACPACGHPIRWYDNVPVLSFLVLRGRCRDCKAPIAWRYPIVELGTALLFALAYVQLGLGWELGLALIFLSALMEEGMDLDATLDQIEARLLTKALERTKGVQTRAVELLRLSFRQFRYKLQKHRLGKDRDAEPEK